MTARASTPQARPAALSTARLTGFSIIAMATASVAVPLNAFLPQFYASSMGLGLTTVGLVFFLSRLWSALSDPLIGFLSDRTRTRFGRRKPWIAAGGVLFLIGVTAVFLPPANAGVAYLTISLLTLCLGLTMSSTPLYAWGGELSEKYHERSRVQTFLQVSSATGAFLILVGPVLLDRLGDTSAADKLHAMAALLLVSVAVGLPILLLLFKEQPSPELPSTRATFPWKTLLQNTLLLRVIASDFFVVLGQGFRGSVLIFFVSAVMGRPELGALLFMLQYGIGILASPIWLRVSYRLGKRRTLLVAELVQVAINLLILTLTPTAVAALFVLAIAQGLSQGSGNLMLKAMVADVADVHRLKTGQHASGLFFSIFNVTQNAAFAIAGGIAFGVLDLAGFSPGKPNTPEALFALQAFFAVAPATGHALSALVMWRYPLDEAQHAEIVRQLKERETA